MANRLAKRSGQKTWFQLSVFFLVVLRVFILPWTAHTFDQAAMASVANRLFIIGSSPLMHFAKSPLLGVPFVIQYALFLKILEWLGLGYNPHLELLLLKIPTLIADLLIAILILKIVAHVTRNRRAGRLAALLWLINPTAFWWGSVSGHYAIFGVAAMVLAFYLALRGHQVLALAALSFHAALYYYPAILLPLFLLFFATTTGQNRNLRAIFRYFARMTVVFGVFWAIQLAPLFLADGELFREPLVKGVLWHAAPSSPFAHLPGVAKLAYYSWYTWPHKVITGLHPDSQNAPVLYNLAHWIMPLGPLLAVVYGLYLLVIYSILRRGKVYTYRRLVADSLVVLTLELMTFSNMHESFILWLIPLCVLYAAISSNYPLAVVGLVMGTLNQYRPISYLGIWERAVPLADIFRIFPWRVAIPDYELSGFVVMLMLLLILAILGLPGSSPSKVQRGYFAPISLAVALAVLMLLFMNIEALMLYSGLRRGDATSRTAQLHAVDYKLFPSIQSEELIDNRDLRVHILLERGASFGDEKVMKKYVYGASYRRFFDFRLFFDSIFEGDIKSVMIGSCHPTPLGAQEFRGLGGYRSWGLTYDFAPCFDELGSEGYPVPVIVVFDKDISVQYPAHRVSALATFIPCTDYLPERAWAVNILAIVSLGVMTLFVVVVAILLHG